MTPKGRSGKFVVRIDPESHKKLCDLAHLNGISLNQLCRTRLECGEGTPSLAEIPWLREEWIHFFKTCHQEWLVNRSEVLGIVLFGSAARDELQVGSDVDLLLVLRPGCQPTREWYRQWEEWMDALRATGSFVLRHEINPQFVSLPGAPLDAGGLWYETAIEGMILGEKDAVVSKFYRMIRGAMAEGKIQRALSHGHPYWIKRKAG